MNTSMVLFGISIVVVGVLILLVGIYLNVDTIDNVFIDSFFVSLALVIVFIGLALISLGIRILKTSHV